MGPYDAIIIGAGHNGLVTATYLARAGWSTVVLEGAPVIGGAVQSGEITRPGFVHDLYSTNQNSFLGGPVWAELGEDLRRHGLSYASSPYPYANAYPDGASLRVYQDAQRTLASLREHDQRDASGWAELHELFERYSPLLFGIYGSTLPSIGLGRELLRGARALGVRGLADVAQLLLASTRELADAYLHSREAKALLACWGMHLDYGPDVAGGALFPFIECFADMRAGMSIVRGGAGGLIDALAGLLRERGGEIRPASPVVRIEVDQGRAMAVQLRSGERIVARRAIIASVTPTALYGQLLRAGDAPERVQRAAARWQYGPGTMMLHLALDGPVPWRDGELGRFAYVHVAPHVEQLAETYTDAANGILPRSPLLVVGQSSVVDPTRAPTGKHVVWVQVRAVPARVRGDRCEQIQARDWRQIAEPYADRVLAKLEDYAPGLGALILARRVLSPLDLERHDPNLVGGDNGAGSHHLRQSFMLRPLPGWSAYRTPIDGLWMTGAATWPGAGVTGVPGYLTARAVLAAAAGPRRPWRAARQRLR